MTSPTTSIKRELWKYCFRWYVIPAMRQETVSTFWGIFAYHNSELVTFRPEMRPHYIKFSFPSLMWGMPSQKGIKPQKKQNPYFFVMYFFKISRSTWTKLKCKGLDTISVSSYCIFLQNERGYARFILLL